MFKLAKKLFMMLVLSVFMISIITATAYAVNTPTEKKIVEFKEKKVSAYNIKWDANGGKIGTKKTVTTTVKKSAKVKLVNIPKKLVILSKDGIVRKTVGKK